MPMGQVNARRDGSCAALVVPRVVGQRQDHPDHPDHLVIPLDHGEHSVLSWQVLLAYHRPPCPVPLFPFHHPLLARHHPYCLPWRGFPCRLCPCPCLHLLHRNHPCHPSCLGSCPRSCLDSYPYPFLPSCRLHPPFGTYGCTRRQELGDQMECCPMERTA
ncbi:hypothetical protein M405DRAFT_474375 [Rhizopogon salebrosus TDB-379]|nr:hypothetical protein M405DRAFT_474375 [Rhizopogon salebrosus TDB-379]